MSAIAGSPFGSPENLISTANIHATFADCGRRHGAAMAVGTVADGSQSVATLFGPAVLECLAHPSAVVLVMAQMIANAGNRLLQ